MRTRPYFMLARRWILLGVFLGIAAGGRGAPVRIELPLEKPVLKLGQGAELAMSQCLVCHSAEYFTTQPFLPRAYWKSAVEKMQVKFGAQIPADQVDPLVDYLFRSYGAK
jgi:hypothetical protein